MKIIRRTNPPFLLNLVKIAEFYKVFEIFNDFFDISEVLIKLVTYDYLIRIIEIYAIARINMKK